MIEGSTKWREKRVFTYSIAYWRAPFGMAFGIAILAFLLFKAIQARIIAFEILWSAAMCLMLTFLLMGLWTTSKIVLDDSGISQIWFGIFQRSIKWIDIKCVEKWKNYATSSVDKESLTIIPNIEKRSSLPGYRPGRIGVVSVIYDYITLKRLLTERCVSGGVPLLLVDRKGMADNLERVAIDVL